MPHGYLYKVGPGQPYATIAAVTNVGGTGQLDIDWGADTFDAPVVVELYTATFAEGIIPNMALKTTTVFPLVFRAATGNSPVVDGSTSTFAVRVTDTPAKHVVIDGISFIGNKSVSGYYINGWIIFKNCSCNITCELPYTFSGGPYYFVDCLLQGSSSQYGFFWNNCQCQFIRCRLFDTFVGNHTCGMYSSSGGLHGIESCVFSGQGFTTAQPLILGCFSGYLSTITNSIFVGGDKALTNYSAPALRLLGITNCIFCDHVAGAIDLSITTWPSDRMCDVRVEACCFYNCGYLVKDKNGTYTTLAQLQAAGYDTQHKCMIADPLFTNKTGLDFTLQAASPCRNAGIGAAVYKDVVKTAVPSFSYPAIGAYFNRDGATSFPAVGHTRAPDVYGPGGTGYTGTETLPDVSVVNSGTQYGAGGTEFTGTLAFTIPNAPTWNGLPTSGNAQVTLPVTADQPTDVVYAVYKPVLTGSWSAQSETFKRTGSGNIVVTGLANGTAYWFAIYSKRSGAYSAWAGAVPCVPSDPAAVTSHLKNLKVMVTARIAALLTSYSITAYDAVTPADVHGNHAVVDLITAHTPGQRYASGYTVDLTIKLYTRPDRSNDNIDDMIDALVEGLHAHSEFSDTYGWHWQSTQFILRNSDIVMDSKTRCSIVEFQLSAKEI